MPKNFSSSMVRAVPLTFNRHGFKSQPDLNIFLSFFMYMYMYLSSHKSSKTYKMYYCTLYILLHMYSRWTYPENSCLVRVGLHLFLNGLLVLVTLRLSEEGAVEDCPAVLDQHLDELELVIAEKQDELVLTVSVVAGALWNGNACVDRG